MGDVINIFDHTPLDQILKSGDVVRVVRGLNEDEALLDLSGIVLDVEKIFGPDSDCPGQAAVFSVGVPLEDEWIVIEDVEISDVIRVIGSESRLIKSSRVKK